MKKLKDKALTATECNKAIEDYFKSDRWIEGQRKLDEAFNKAFLIPVIERMYYLISHQKGITHYGR